MVGAFRILRKSIRHYRPKASIFPDNSASQQWLHQTRRTLILETAPSVSLRKLPGIGSGVVEVSLERPQVKNAIGKEMLDGLQSCNLLH